MSENNVLDHTLIKDLSNHIYEKRKATAFQIENLTKAALARNDSQTIYKIISQLTALTTDSTNSAKMGAITALGSVSVALGSFAIAYFLEDIVKPIFATFRDMDARVRYYACESLYNIAKIARGEILMYFNEIFDVLCILVTDTESSVKNAADILDRLVKDIISAKATNYVSVIQQQTSSEIKSHLVHLDGNAIQINNIQDTLKAFSLPKFIPTLLERMYTVDPFAKKFLISWIELFDDIPSLELITFLPNFLEQLIKFLMNNAPTDVRLETQNILNTFLTEIKSINMVKLEAKKRQLISERNKKLENSQSVDPEEEENNLTEEVKGIKLHESELETYSINSNSTTIIKNTNRNNLADSSTTEDDSEVFLSGQNIFIDYSRIIDILLSFLGPRKPDLRYIDTSNESHEVKVEIQAILLKWLQEILNISPTSFIKYLPEIISILMKNIASTSNSKDFDLRNQFLKFNISLKEFLITLNESEDQNSNEEGDISEKMLKGLNKEVSDEFTEFYLSSTLQTTMHEALSSSNELARVTSLDWLIFLYSQYPQNFFKTEQGSTFDLIALLKSSTDASNEVILKALQLLSKISENDQGFFKDFIVKLISFFESELLEKNNSLNLSRSKIEFIIRKLCVTLDSERIFQTLSEVLTTTTDLKFLNMMVVTLNNILLTASELMGFRKKLKELDVYKVEDWSLFSTLFQSWSHNAPSALSLCLLTSNYELAYLIIKNLSELEVDFQLLTQLDVLVQLLESPIFLKLRLQLLEPEKNAYLYKTLYGLLMVFPQSSTFTTLKNRLDSISHIHNINMAPFLQPSVSAISTPVTTPVTVPTPNTNLGNQLSIKRKRVYEMLDKFAKIQEKHVSYQMKRKISESLNDDIFSNLQKNEKMGNSKSAEHSDYFNFNESNNDSSNEIVPKKQPIQQRF